MRTGKSGFVAVCSLASLVWGAGGCSGGASGPGPAGDLGVGGDAGAGTGDDAGTGAGDLGAGGGDLGAGADMAVRLPGTRFAAAAQSWSVPPSGLGDGFFATQFADAGRYWGLLDLDGDGRLDLVQTADPANSRVFGGTSAFWKVFKNTGSGFAATAQSWSVPPSGLGDGFFAARFADAGRYWGLFDLDGDGKLDLVQTADPANSRVFGGTSAFWKVFKNTGSGFAATAQSWGVPPSGLGDGFFASSFADAGRYWGLFDLDGDGKLDLVQTADPATSRVFGGTSAFWKVFKNTGSGFAATAQSWSVPPSGLGDGFFAASFNDGARVWSLIDLDGDGRQELVHTADPASGRVFGGAPGSWKVYKNTGSAFSGTAQSWGLPASGLPDGFFASSVFGSGRFWSTLDLDGDGKPELVHTADTATSQVFTDTGALWKVYKSTGSGFSTTAQRWGVPASGLPDGFFAAFSSGSSRYWSLVDLDGDGRLDLVHTADPASSQVFGGASAFWKVYPSTP